MAFSYSNELLSVTSRMLLMVIIIIANDDNGTEEGQEIQDKEVIID